jgi:serine/threonine protein kinase
MALQVGTYGYMAPEQFRGTAQPASDLFALGATLLFLLSGMTLAYVLPVTGTRQHRHMHRLLQHAVT